MYIYMYWERCIFFKLQVVGVFTCLPAHLRAAPFLFIGPFPFFARLAT